MARKHIVFTRDEKLSRHLHAALMRRDGWSFQRIGAAFDVGANYANQMCLKGERWVIKHNRTVDPDYIGPCRPLPPT